MTGLLDYVGVGVVTVIATVIYIYISLIAGTFIECALYERPYTARWHQPASTVLLGAIGIPIFVAGVFGVFAIIGALIIFLL